MSGDTLNATLYESGTWSVDSVNKQSDRTFSDATAASNPFTVGSLTPYKIGETVVNTGSNPKVAWYAVGTSGAAGSWVSISPLV